MPCSLSHPTFQSGGVASESWVKIAISNFPLPNAWSGEKWGGAPCSRLLCRGVRGKIGETMAKLHQFWKRIPKTIRKPLVFIVGFAIVVAGIAMLVLPGPGWAAIFLGFAVLATEFAFAEKVRDWLVDNLKRIIRIGQDTWKNLSTQKKRSTIVLMILVTTIAIYAIICIILHKYVH